MMLRQTFSGSRQLPVAIEVGTLSVQRILNLVLNASFSGFNSSIIALAIPGLYTPLFAIVKYLIMFCRFRISSLKSMVIQ